jgi:NAD(P)-dependent dehydrogenase (short-subunit alcohol dehydrogenase family)
VEAELANIEDCYKIVRRCDEEFGRVDGLVNAAACTERGTLENTSPEHWDKFMAINVRAPFLLIQDSARLMKRIGEGGSIVNILSIAAYGGMSKLTPYSVSKGALAILTKNAGHSLKADRIRVNGVNVGWMDTPNEHVVQKSEGQPDNWLEIAEATMPYGRILRPSDIAGFVTYMLSDAAQMMNGSVIDYDQHVIGVLEP